MEKNIVEMMPMFGRKFCTYKTPLVSLHSSIIILHSFDLKLEDKRIAEPEGCGLLFYTINKPYISILCKIHELR